MIAVRALLIPAAAALAAAAVLPGTAVAAAPAHKAAPVARDWTRTVVATPQGGFRMGNPAARVKLIEYGSFGCPHCADFAREASAQLRSFVRHGRVSWEFRPYVIFAPDPGISMLLRCRGPAGYFDLVDQLYTEQKSWIGRLKALPEATLQQIQAMETHEQVRALVRAAGIDAFFRMRGMSQARIDACLADGSALESLLALTNRATDLEDVHRTPTFFINGRQAETNVWAGIEPLIRQAGG